MIYGLSHFKFQRIKKELEMSINIQVVTDNCEFCEWMKPTQMDRPQKIFLHCGQIIFSPICVYGARRILVEASFLICDCIEMVFFLLNLLLTQKKKWITQQVIFHIFLALSLSLRLKFRRSPTKKKKKTTNEIALWIHWLLHHLVTS